MEEDCGGGQGLTKGCGAKGRRRRRRIRGKSVREWIGFIRLSIGSSGGFCDKGIFELHKYGPAKKI
jgi:hypothetical protein